MSLPSVKQEFFELAGGLDMLTPAIAVKPGVAIDAQNFEPEITGGYKRYAGHERYDGHTAPSSATYYIIGITTIATISVGDTITGVTSSATAKVLAVNGSSFVIGRVTGTFVSAESVTVSATPKGTTTSAALLKGSSDPLTDAQNTLLAANDLRNSISAVPGSGQIRGVWVYDDVVYAFRNNAGGTAGEMYKATASGWQLVAFGTEIKFSSTMGGTTPIYAGQVIGNSAAPTKTATVVAVLTTAGVWGTNATGSMIITPLTGSFANADPIYVSATQKAVATTAATAITRAPGGRLEFVNANFTSSTDSLKMYGVDGVNPLFEFDGTNYIPIYTGMTTDTPGHVAFHKNHLFLSFRGSVQFSAITNPYGWSAVLGAGEIATGDPVTGFLPQTGNSSGASMAIFNEKQTFILYGSSSADWSLTQSTMNVGYAAYTMQPVSNNTYGLTARGIQSMITTQNYGDFDFASVAHQVNPFITLRRGLATASTTLRTKDQYRLYYSDNSCLCLGLTGEKISGVMPLDYGMPVRCIATDTLSTGEEVTYFGSDDGYVYRDNIGGTMDGDAVEAWVRLAFNHNRSPQLRKRYRRAVLEVKAAGYAQLNMGYDLGYGDRNVAPPVQQPNQVLSGVAGSNWDQVIWDGFVWDSSYLEQPRMSLEGVERNIGFTFLMNQSTDSPLTIQGVTVFFNPLRAER